MHRVHLLLIGALILSIFHNLVTPADATSTKTASRVEAAPELNYTEIIPPLVKAVQEQQAQVNAQKVGLAKVTDDVAELKKALLEADQMMEVIKAQNDNLKAELIAIAALQNDVNAMKTRAGYTGEAPLQGWRIIILVSAGGAVLAFFLIGGALRNRRRRPPPG